MYLNNKFSIEHIIPHSSTWVNGEIDIDRVGNLIPIIDKMNKERSNKHIDYYYNTDKVYTSFIKSIPSIEEYNSIITHTNSRDLKIIAIEKYNSLCEKNEKLYIDNLIHCIFT
jgi:hypothetical protein